MTTTSHHVKTPDDRDVIPVDDVPAFGVQIRFAKRKIAELLAHLRSSNGSSDRSSKHT